MKKNDKYYSYLLLTKVIFYSSLFFAIFIGQVQAHVITVDNNYPGIGQFNNLQAAHDAAASSDTLYVIPSGVAYAAITLTKKLTIYGAGFESPQPTMPVSLISGTMIFDPGSNGSQLQGFGYGNGFSVLINTSDILIKRNKIWYITVNQGNSGTVIIQNFISSNFKWLGDGTPKGLTVNSDNEVFLSNNIFQGADRFAIAANTPSVTIMLINNVFSSVGPYGGHIYVSQKLDIANSNHLVQNNIFESESENLTYMYNNISTNSLPSGNGNISNVSLSDIFINSDNDFHLKPSSPAIGSGLNGVDMGIYGGDTPFIDGGYPDMPVIYFLDVPLNANQKDGLNVIIKSKTNR